MKRFLKGTVKGLALLAVVGALSSGVAAATAPVCEDIQKWCPDKPHICDAHCMSQCGTPGVCGVDDWCICL